MRHLVAVLFFSLAAVFPAHADNNADVQEGIFNSYLKLANEGDVVAQYVVAQRYENGKGTTKDMEKAIYWYEMAARQNYPLALVKLEEHNKAKEPPKPEAPAPAAVKAETVAAAPAPVKTPPPPPPPAPAKKEPVKKAAPPAREVSAPPKEKPVKPAAVAVATVAAVPVAPKPAEPETRREEPRPEVKPAAPEIVVARAAPVEEPPMPSINVAQTLLSGKWKRNQQEAEYLPSAHSACLQSSGIEIVCFSQEMTRNIENSGLTYNVKSVISGINNKEAKFNLRYIYNVVHISGKPHADPNGMPSEVSDMALKTGWQEPGVTMECRFRDEQSLSCMRNDRKMTYQFMRE